MKRSMMNPVKSGDTNPRGQPRSWLLELYVRSPPSGREHGTSAACGGQTALWYTLNEDQRTEREVRNCPPKRVRSSSPRWHICSRRSFSRRLGKLSTGMGQAELTGRASSSLRASWNNGFRRSAYSFELALTGLRRFGGLRYPKGRARQERGRWEFPLSRTACFKRRWRAFSKRFSKQTSATSAMDIGLGEALITRCVRYACRS
jgi:hypothetical protein